MVARFPTGASSSRPCDLAVPAVLTSTRIEVDDHSLVLHLPEPDLVPEPAGLRARLQTLARSMGVDDFRMVLPHGDTFAVDFESILV